MTVVTLVTAVVLKLRKSMVSRCKQSLSEVYIFIGTRFFGIFFGVTVPLNSSSWAADAQPYTHMYTVHCTQYNVYFLLYTVHRTLYTLHCTLYTVYYTLYTVCCTLYTVHCTLYTFCCLLYTESCMLESVYCMLYIVH